MKLEKYYKGDPFEFSRLKMGVLSDWAHKMFVTFFKEVANIKAIKSKDINFMNSIEVIKEKYNITEDDIIFEHYVVEKQDEVESKPSFIFAIIKEGLVFVFCNNRPYIYYSDENSDEVKDLEGVLTNLDKISNSGINILCHSQFQGFYLTSFKVNKMDFNLEKHYNDDFLSVNDKIIERLNTDNDKGIVILHGQPGTGKSTYIRHLCHNLDKRIVYIPPDMAKEISSPNFIPFLMTIPNSILMIEDSENVLEKRTGGSSQAVSNLLNISDGILSDCLSMQLICTFNTDIDRIDSALLRPGRLIAKYEFGPLTKEKSRELVKYIGSSIEVGGEMSVSEIYNPNDEKEKEKESIGFKHTHHSIHS